MMNDNQCVYVMYAWIWTDMDCTAVPIFWCCFVWYCHPWFHPDWRLVWRDCPACITLQFAAGGRYVFMRTEGPDIFQWRQLGSPNTTFQPQPLFFFFRATESPNLKVRSSTNSTLSTSTTSFKIESNRFWGEIFLLVLNHLSYALGWKIYDPHHQHPSTLRCRLDLQTLEVKTVWGTCFHLVFVDRCSVVFYLVLHYKLGLIWRDLFLKVLKGRWGS